MGVVKRQSIKSMMATYAGLVFGYLNLAYFFPKLLTTEQIGLISFLLGTSNMILALVQLGMPNTIIKFRPIINDLKAEKGLVKYSIQVPLIVFVLVFGTLFLAKDFLFETYYADEKLLGEFYFILPVFTLFMAFLGIFAAHSRSLFRIVVPNFIDKVVVRSLVFGLLMAFGAGLISYGFFVTGYAIIYGVAVVLVLVYFLFIKKEKQLTFHNNPIPGDVKKQMLTFGSLSFLTIMGGQVVENIDIMMITSMNNLSDAGIYKTAFYIGGVIMIPMGALGQIAAPVFAEAWKNNDLGKVENMYKKSSINLSVIGCLIFIGLYINIDNIFSIMPNGDRFVSGKGVILLIAFSKLISMFLSVNSQLIANSAYYYVNVITIIILAILTIGLNLLFIPEYGIVGAALASALALIIFNFIKFGFIAFKFKMHPFSFKSLILISITVITVLINTLIPSFENVFIDTGIRSAIVSVIYILAVYGLNISPDLTQMANNVLSKIGIKP